MATKYVTKAELKDELRALHDDLKENHFKAVLDAIAHLLHAEAKDTREIKEKLMALQNSVDTLGALVAKVVVDGATTQKMIVDLKAEIDRLVNQGSANQVELDALKATVAAAETAIDADNAQLQTLDDTVQDPSNPIDPNAPI